MSDLAQEALYATHDGGGTWQEVKLTPPRQVGAAIDSPFQGTPIFQNPQKGYLVVHYSGYPGIPTKLVVYSTIRDEFLIDPNEDVIGRMCEMISQEPQSFRLSGPLSKAQAIMGFALLVLFLFPGSLAAASDLLAPNTGWAARGNKLYWTFNNGANWTDITPVLPNVRRQAVRSVQWPFFRNRSEGWTIIEYQPPTAQPMIDTPAYTIAHTVDSGASWSFAELTYPQLPHWDQLRDAVAAPGNLFFIDSLHGWVVIPFAGLSRPGKLLATVDGGKTWNWVNNAGSSGPMTFATLQDGWQLDVFADKLYVTHDGCKTWQEVSNLPLPPQVSSGTFRRLVGLPVFQEQYKGYLVIQYLDANGGLAKLVVYSTSDTGKSWQPVKVLDQAPDAVGGIFDIVDSTIIVCTGSSGKNVSVATVPLNGGASNVKASNRGISGLKFADSANGWASLGDGLLATHDGGSTWKDITPPSPVPPLPTRTVPITKKSWPSICAIKPPTTAPSTNASTSS